MPWTLLTIPPEIRDVIIETTLLSARPAPPDIAVAASTHQAVEWDWRNNLFLTWRYGIFNVQFEKPGAYISSAAPLLLTNRQLNAETRSAITRLDDKARCYSLDVLVVNERELWPVWTSVPILTHHVEQVDVTFRLCASKNHLRQRHNALRAGDGSPAAILWCFYFILEHFLKCGPGGTFGIPRKDREICVKMVHVDFVAGKGQVMLEKRASWWRIHTAPTVDHTRIMRPLWLAELVLGSLNRLLAMDYHTAQYGAILHERMGIIRVLLDGKLLSELDIAHGLAKLDHNAGDTFGHLPRQNRVSAFRKWKRDAVKLRVKRGLPVEEGGVFEE